MSTWLQNEDLKSTTIAGEGMSDSQTTVTVADGQFGPGVVLGTPCELWVWGVAFSDPGQDEYREKLLCTLIDGETLTVVRAQGGTTAHAHAAGDRIANLVSVGTIKELQARAVPVGGTEDQVLAKASEDDYDLVWTDAGAGGEGDVIGPASAITGHIPTFADITGKVLADGINPASLQSASSILSGLSALEYVSPSLVKMIGEDTFSLDNTVYLSSLTGAVLVSLGTTKGDLITFSSAGNPVRVGAGSVAGNLRTDGSGNWSIDSSVYLTSLSGAALLDQSTPQTIGETAHRLAKLWVSDLDVTNTIIGTVGTAALATSVGTTTHDADSGPLWLPLLTAQSGGALVYNASLLYYNPNSGILHAGFRHSMWDELTTVKQLALRSASSVALTTDRLLTVDVVDGNRTLKLGANLEVTGAASVQGTNTGDQTLPTDATLATTDVTDNDASTTKHGFSPKAVAPSAGNLALLGIANTETIRADKLLLDNTSPSTQAFGDSTAAGTLLKAARIDHKHAMPAMPNRSDVGLGNVDNTSDANKPVSTAQQTALDAKVALLNQKYLWFNAANSRITLGVAAGAITEISAVAHFTLSVWVNFVNFSADRYLFSASVDSTHRVLFFYSASANAIRCYVSDGGTTYGESATGMAATLGTNKWHHFAMDYDGTLAAGSRLTLYIDGVASALTMTGTIPALSPNLSSVAAIISVNSSTTMMVGFLRRFAIYSASLAAADALSLYAGINITANQAHYYLLNKGTGTSVTDTGSNPVGGTVAAATWVDVAAPWGEAF